MTFYHLHYTELRINLMKHRHRISSFVILIVRNKKLVANVFACENYFYFKNGVLVQSPLASPGSLFAACSPPSVNASVFTSSRAVYHPHRHFTSVEKSDPVFSFARNHILEYHADPYVAPPYLRTRALL